MPQNRANLSLPIRRMDYATDPLPFFAGDCFPAMTLYAEALGGEVVAVMRNSDAAPEDRMPGDYDLVMHRHSRPLRA